MFKHLVLAVALFNAACLYLIFTGKIVANNLLIGTWAGYFIVSMVLIFLKELAMEKYMEQNKVAIDKFKKQTDYITNDNSLTTSEKQAKLLKVMLNQGENNE